MSTVGSHFGLPTSMTIQRANCNVGTHTLVLSKMMSGNIMTGMYTFPSGDLWDYWGGCTVTVVWVGDRGGSNIWGEAVPPISYPVLDFPDGTLLRASGPPRSNPFSVVQGGAEFAIRETVLPGIRLSCCSQPASCLSLTG